MKRLVLGIIVAAVTSQAAGCIFVSDDDDGGDVGEEAVIEANWNFTSFDGTATGCPPGSFIEVITQEVDESGNPIGPEIGDRYNCEDGGGITDPLPPSSLSVFLRGINGTQTYTSFLQFVDITTENKVVDFDLISDGGFVAFQWELVGGTSGNPLECGDVPDLDPNTGVGSIATNVATPTEAFDDQFNCDDHSGTTHALRNGQQVISIDAFNAQNESLAEEPFNQTVTIEGPNDIVELGSVDIPIAGL